MNGRKKEVTENIRLIQALLNRNISIEHIADIMTEFRREKYGATYWRERVLELIEDGELTA